MVAKLLTEICLLKLRPNARRKTRGHELTLLEKQNIEWNVFVH